MSTFWARHRRGGISGLGAVLMATGLSTMNVAAQPTGADYDDPVKLFGEMMPVFSSPRCVNCHGGTDPNPAPDGVNHDGSQVDVGMDSLGNMNVESNGACRECHSVPEAAGWHLAPLPMSFVGKDTLQMCRQMRASNSLADPGKRQGFIDHIENDPLIGLAFEGKGGIGDDTAMGPISPEPPPQSKQQFLANAARWLTDGEAACKNEWNGTITETATMTQRETFAPAPGGREVGTDLALTVTVARNTAAAEVHWELHDLIDVPLKECLTHVHLNNTAVGYKLPVDFTIALNTPKVQVVITPPAGADLTPPASFELPPGFEFPPGFELPPGFEFPPGFQLPPGMTMPPGTDLPPGAPVPSVGPFFRYASNASSEVGGNNHLDTVGMPGCKQTITDTRQPYHIDGALIELTVDPNNPNHIVGQKELKLPVGSRVIKWDLRHDVE